MESMSDIVAQMRGRGEDGRMDRRLWLDYADRIEAAWKREKAEAEANALAVGGIVEAARQDALVNLNNAYNFVNAAEVWCVCRMCQGNGCKVCHGRGWQTEEEYKRNPKEFQAEGGAK